MSAGVRSMGRPASPMTQHKHLFYMLIKKIIDWQIFAHSSTVILYRVRCSKRNKQGSLKKDKHFRGGRFK